jgi:hypothetical protein
LGEQLLKAGAHALTERSRYEVVYTCGLPQGWDAAALKKLGWQSHESRAGMFLGQLRNDEWGDRQTAIASHLAGLANSLANGEDFGVRCGAMSDDTALLIVLVHAAIAPRPLSLV